MVVTIRLPQYTETLPTTTRRTRRNAICRAWSRWRKGWVIGVVLFVELVRLLLAFARKDESRWGGGSGGNAEDARWEGGRNVEKVEEDLGPELEGLTRLVVVTCHAVWVGGTSGGRNESEWMIEDFQRGEADTYIRHIEAGAKIAAEDPKSLLVFSGGETKVVAGPLSEAESYYRLAITLDFLPDFLLSRTTTELHARDSYQNLIFSICRFHELTSTYPESITVISHAFKRQRFVHQHRRALRFPEANFRFVGLDPPKGMSDAVLQGEERTRKVWEADLYGCRKDGELRRKRKGRNPGRRWDGGYTTSCPQVRGLLGFCPKGSGDLYPGKLPW